MTTAIDPVCDMEVDTSDPPGGSCQHEGATYYFCSSFCLGEFKADPARYLPA